MKKITLFFLSFLLTLGAMAADVNVSYRVKVEGWTSANANTHFGGITFTCNEAIHQVILTSANMEAASIKLDVSGEVSLS